MMVLFMPLAVLCLYSTVSYAAIPNTLSVNKIPNTEKKEPHSNGAALYPQASETRDLRKLDGIWDFRRSPPDPQYGYRHGWYLQDLFRTGPVIPMPVPSSFNDVGEDATLRDHVGLVWYDRRFFVPLGFKKNNQRIWLRFSSVHYAAKVWLNGKAVMQHEIGHLPFQVEITNQLHENDSNLLTVNVDNTLLRDTVPQGSYDEKSQSQIYTFDFFNYAGIHRSVFLYTTPPTYVTDVIVNTNIEGMTGLVVYVVAYEGANPDSKVECLVQLYDKNENLVTTSNGCASLLEVPNATLWWPFLMHDEPGYLYTLKASLIDSKGAVMDTYRQKIGIRQITWTNTSILINDKPLYMRGFGMHEDSDLRGKGWDPVLWTKNFNLIQWTGGNTFRTSHYPYAEEIYQMADERGIMIIDECPSVDTDGFTDSLLARHKQSLTELILRDKNHPSVIMWSISNEPRSQRREAGPYFKSISEHVRSMDRSRPITLACAQNTNDDKSAPYLDIISFNRYNGWYQNPGQFKYIVPNVIKEAQNWHRTYNKPVLMSEYGADTVPGLHYTPEFVFSEEYQVTLLSEHFKAFDKLRAEGFFVGEFVWNFADFMTAQTVTRVGGNKKGIFTRSRQPKAAAHVLRLRYSELAATDDGAPLPPNLSTYTSDHLPPKHIEL